MTSQFDEDELSAGSTPST